MTLIARTAIVLALALGAACSNNSSPHGTLTDAAAHADAEHGSNAPPADAGPQAIALQNFGSVPTFLAYRAGSGAWQTPTTSDGGQTYTITALNDFVFVAACISTDGTISETQIDATVGDSMLSFECFSDDTGTGSAAPVVAVTGTMKQPGFVAMSASAFGSAANWSFSLDEPPDSEVALQDLFAVGSAAMLIQRDIDIGSGASYAAGALDLGSGAAFVPVAIAVTNMTNDDSFEGFDELATPNEFVTVSETTSPTTITPTPASLVGSKDFEIWDLNAADATSSRRYETYAGAASSFAMPDSLTGITFATGGASWTSLDSAWQDVGLDLSGGSMTLLHNAEVIAYADWIASTTATSLAFDDSAPSWQSAWSFWKSEAYQPSFLAEQETQTSYESSTAIGASTSPAFASKRLRATSVRGLGKRAIHRNRR